MSFKKHASYTDACFWLSLRRRKLVIDVSNTPGVNPSKESADAGFLRFAFIDDVVLQHPIDVL